MLYFFQVYFEENIVISNCNYAIKCNTDDQFTKYISGRFLIFDLVFMTKIIPKTFKIKIDRNFASL